MRIILAAPKSLPGDLFRFDYSYWNFYFPLVKLGHNVTFFDTTVYGDTELSLLIDKEKPDLLFCIMTGDNGFCPKEPWKTIADETKKGNVITFNWFCDDSYRFDTFSSKVCKLFHYCSTPEKRFLPNYIKLGYSNILYATWHANVELYSSPKVKKDIELSFIGGYHGDRIEYLNFLRDNSLEVITYSGKLSFEDMIYIHSRSKICLNFTKDSSGNSTQMKARIFEVIASKSLLVTEYTPDIDNCFRADEILTFSDKEELLSKIKWCRENNTDIFRLKGFERVKREHDSSIRLQSLLHHISK